MIAAFLCAVLAICEPAPPPASGLPDWSQTAPLAVPLIQRWEGTGPTEACAASPSGLCFRAYLDTLPEPDVPTIAHGQTRLFRPDGSVLRAVRMGDVLTAEDAAIQFAAALRVQYWARYRACVSAAAMTAQTDAAMTSLTWNVGVGAICGSTAMRRLNAGDMRGACEALTWYNRAGGRVIRGLVNRRADEHALCIEGLP